MPLSSIIDVLYWLLLIIYLDLYFKAARHHFQSIEKHTFKYRHKMKSLLLLSTFLTFFCIATLQASDKDSLNWLKADRELQSGNYQQASDLYSALDKRMDTIYTEINLKKVEDLRRTYSIDEVQLQSDIVLNKLLLFCAGAGILILLLCIGFFFYTKHQNKLLLRSREELNRAKTLAEESIRNKSLFLSNMSHEIKTPLNALSGFSEVLTMPGIDEATREQCNEVIQLNSELLLKLLNDVIDISCLDVTNMKFQIKPCEAVALCRNVVKTLGAIKQTNAEMTFETDCTALELETDAERLQQMLINLLVNATKFTKEGSIILKLEKTDDGMARFSVTDTGCGIPPEKQKDIFNRFEKLNESAQGTGLGLSICLLIIKRLGGDIRIDSEYREGCRFVFVHPLKQEVRL